MEQRFNKTDLKIEKIESTLRLLQWMMGFNLALVVAVFLLLLRSVV